MTQCPICKDHYYTTSHACPPEWEFHIEDYHDEGEWDMVRATDAESAATRACEIADNYGSSEESDHRGRTITVRRDEEDEPKRFMVMIEFEPRWYAKPAIACADCGETFAGEGYLDPGNEPKLCSLCRSKARRAARAETPNGVTA